MMLCGFQQEHYIAYTKSPDVVSHNVMSVMLQIRASDLAAQHQRLLTDQAHAKETRVQQTRTYSQELIACAPCFNTLRLCHQVCKHANMITSHL